MHSDTWPFLFFRFFFWGRMLSWCHLPISRSSCASSSQSLTEEVARWRRPWAKALDFVKMGRFHPSHGDPSRLLWPVVVFFWGGIESSKHRKWSILLNGNANLNIKILKNHPKTAVLTLSDNIRFFFFFPHPSGKYIVYYWLQSLATLTLPPIITDYLHIHESQYLLTD